MLRILGFGLVLITATSLQTKAEVICNEKSEFTNVRAGPGAKDFSVLDKLINGEHVEIVRNITNKSGFNYYFIEYSNSVTGDSASGYVYAETVAAECGNKQPSTVEVEKTNLESAGSSGGDGANLVVCATDQWKFGFKKIADDHDCNNPRIQWVINPIFNFAYEFVDGLASVQNKDGKSGFIDSRGHWVVMPEYDGSGSYSEGFVNVLKSGKWGFIDKNGNVVVPFKYRDAGYFSEGLAWVNEDGAVGFINKSGQWAIQPIYSEASSFKDGTAVVWDKERNMLRIDRSGNIVSTFVSDGNSAIEHPVGAQLTQDQNESSQPNSVFDNATEARGGLTSARIVCQADCFGLASCQQTSLSLASVPSGVYIEHSIQSDTYDHWQVSSLTSVEGRYEYTCTFIHESETVGCSGSLDVSSPNNLYTIEPSHISCEYSRIRAE